MKPLLFLTHNAKEYLNSIRKEKTIKFGIKKSGCSGFAYVIDLVEKNESDIVFNDIPFSIDEKSYDGINNCEIDYVKDGFSSKLVFNNPNVVNSCGCGESFNLK